MIQPLERAISELKRLPGVGRKTAERLTFYLLTRNEDQIQRLSESLLDLNQRVTECQVCHNFAEGELCEICNSNDRDRSQVCVVSRPWDVAKIESTGKYDGLYHVLGGLINPIEDVDPEDLNIQDLLSRIKDEEIEEVILALEPKTEGESTGMYIRKQIQPLGVEITQIAQGVPVGRDLEFTDKATLGRAFEGRRSLD